MISTSNLINLKLHSPGSIEEALAFLTSEQCCPIAGGTDIIPAIRSNRVSLDALVDLSRIDELRFIEHEDDTIRIGALTTYTDLIESSILNKICPIIVETALHVGAEQTRNRGTVGGSLGNASPAADLAVTLLALDAQVCLVSLKGQRTLSLERFFIGPGKTALLNGELIHHVSFNTLPPDAQSIFLKLGRRREMTCAVANLAMITIMNDHGVIVDPRIAVGAVAPKPIRCKKTEMLLRNNPIDEVIIGKGTDTICCECSPIDDIRATATYRNRSVGVLFRRAISKLGDCES